MRIRDYVTGRVVAWIIIAILASAFGMSRAEAATREEAWNACAARGAVVILDYPGSQWRCLKDENFNQYRLTRLVPGPGNDWTAPPGTTVFVFVPCPAGTPWDDVVKKCKALCVAGAQQSGSCNASKGGQCTTLCDNYCLNTFTHTRPEDDWTILDGPKAGYWKQGIWTETGASCLPGEHEPDEPPPECPVGQKKLTDGTCGVQGECPVGMHEVPATGACTPDGACPTGQQKAPDGSCIAEQCPAGFAKKKDGTCGLDEDGDGEVDADEEGNEDGDKASGGESCDVPPACSGNAIMCLQAKIQWRIDCNTRKQRTVTGGACGSPPICTGEKCDALEYSTLTMSWRSACALEKLGQGAPGSGDGTIGGGSCETNYTCSGGNPMLCASLQEQNRMRCAAEKRRSEIGDAAAGGDGDDGQGDAFINPGSPAELNQGLVSYGGGVPDISFTVEGQRFDPFGGAFAGVIAMIKWLIIAGASVTAFFIMRGSF